MKTQTFTQKNAIRALSFFGLFMLMTIAMNPLFAQTTERVVKGVVSDEDGPLQGATVYLEGTSYAITTNSKGEFTFPKLLKEGDVLTFLHLGYREQKIPINAETTFINLNLTDYEIVIVGALKVGSNTAPEPNNR